MKILHQAQAGYLIGPGELVPQSHAEAQAVCLLAAVFLEDPRQWRDGVPKHVQNAAQEFRRLATVDEPTLRQALLSAYMGPLAGSGTCGEEIWGLLTWAGHPDFPMVTAVRD